MPIIKKINDLEPSISPLTDEELKAKTPEFKERLANGETLDDLYQKHLLLFVKQLREF